MGKGQDTDHHEEQDKLIQLRSQHSGEVSEDSVRDIDSNGSTAEVNHSQAVNDPTILKGPNERPRSEERAKPGTSSQISTNADEKRRKLETFSSEAVSSLVPPNHGSLLDALPGPSREPNPAQLQEANADGLALSPDAQREANEIPQNNEQHDREMSRFSYFGIMDGNPVFIQEYTGSLYIVDDNDIPVYIGNVSNSVEPSSIFENDDYENEFFNFQGYEELYRDPNSGAHL